MEQSYERKESHFILIQVNFLNYANIRFRIILSKQIHPKIYLIRM